MHLHKSRFRDLMVHVAQVADGATWNSQSRRTSMHGISRAHHRSGRSRLPDEHRLRPAGRRNQRSDVHQTGGPIDWDGLPRVPPSGLPTPSVSWDKHPGSVAIWHPSPRIRGSEHVAEARVEAPCPIHKGIPANTSEVGLPHHPVAGHIAVCAVIVQITDTVAVGRGIVLGVLIVVLNRLFIPRIERFFFDLAGNSRFVVIGGIEGRGLLLLNRKVAVWSFDIHITLEYR